jgi:isochorismate hydrolase
MGCAPGSIDRPHAVLVVIDIQDRLADVMARRDEVVRTARFLMRAADVLDIPVVVTRQYPKGLGDTVGELLETQESLTGSVEVVDKTCFCCGEEVAFTSALEATGRDQVVIVGMETHICVTQTALSLAGEGRSVHVAADGVCSRRDLDHETALARLGHAGVVVTTAESVVYEALGRAGTPEFKAVLGLVKEG